MLLGIRIKNFDVFDDDTCGALMEDTKDKLRLRNLNALIGRNKTGKTSFLMAISYVKRIILSDSAAASKDDGRPGFSNLLLIKDKPCEFVLYFKLKDIDNKPLFLQYNLEISPSKYGSPFISKEEIKLKDGTIIMDIKSSVGFVMKTKDSPREETSIRNEHLTALSIYGKISNYKEISLLYREIERWFFCSFSSNEKDSYYIEGNAPGGHKHLNSHGTNVNNYLLYLKDQDVNNYESLLSSIRSLIPSMKKKKRLPEKLESSPDRLFLYLLLLHDKDPHSTIFMETPDMDLYHDMVDVLSDEMRDYTMRNPFSQIVFSTHNPYIVESMNPKEIWIFRREFDHDKEAMRINCAGESQIVSELFSQGVGMGAIWYGGYLDLEESDDEEE